MSKPFITPPAMPVMPPRPLPPGEVEVRMDHGVLSYVVRDLAHIAVAFAVARDLES